MQNILLCGQTVSETDRRWQYHRREDLLQRRAGGGHAQERHALLAVGGSSAPCAALQGCFAGSTSLTANADGTWNSTLKYTAFGELRSAEGTTPTKYQYTGQLSQMDEIGLYYYVARFYDPVISHFAQADTLIPEPGMSVAYDRYAYVQWNPIRYIDPGGHYIFEGGWQEPRNHSYPTGSYTYGETYFYSPLSAEKIWGIKVSMRVSQATANDPSGTGKIIGVVAMMAPMAIQASIANQPMPYNSASEKLPKRLSNDVEPQVNTGTSYSSQNAKVASKLPVRIDGKGKTTGILDTDGQQYMLVSGRNGPASHIPSGTSGFDIVTRTHVEGHAAAIMQQNNYTYGTLCINNIPCPSCDANLTRMLPPNAILRIIAPGGFDKFFKGN